MMDCDYWRMLTLVDDQMSLDDGDFIELTTMLLKKKAMITQN